MEKGKTKFKKGHTPWNKGLKTGITPWKGKTRSEEDKKKISENRKGKLVGENHWRWKGNNVTYFTLHQWVNKWLGKARVCSFNPSHQSGRYHWANISKSYVKDLDDWVSLCPKCHREYDNITGGRVRLRG